MDALIIVKPETDRLAKAAFQKILDWKVSQTQKAWQAINYLEIRQIIEKIATENFIWGAPSNIF